MIVICREMGWDYYTYVSQPVFFLNAVKQFLVDEQKAQLREMQKMKQKR